MVIFFEGVVKVENSKFKLYSLGIVAKDKPTATDTIVVMPIEHITDTTGEINEETDYSSSSKNHRNVPNKTKAVSKNTLEATWICLGGSNRISSPDVIAGETVLIYTYADTNEYYWTTYLREPSIRRLEKVLYGFSNMRGGARSESFDRETSYWFEVDTLNKYVKLHTSDNDGELTTYDVLINTKEGVLEIKDGIGNSVLMNSSEGSLTVTMNSKVTLKAPEIVLDGDVTTTGTQAIVGKATLQSGMGVSGGGGSTVDVDGSITINGNGMFSGNVEASNIN